jgi:hypothetical protein
MFIFEVESQIQLEHRSHTQRQSSQAFLTQCWCACLCVHACAEVQADSKVTFEQLEKVTAEGASLAISMDLEASLSLSLYTLRVYSISILRNTSKLYTHTLQSTCINILQYTHLIRLYYCTYTHSAPPSPSAWTWRQVSRTRTRAHTLPSVHA